MDFSLSQKESNSSLFYGILTIVQELACDPITKTNLNLESKDFRVQDYVSGPNPVADQVEV